MPGDDYEADTQEYEKAAATTTVAAFATDEQRRWAASSMRCTPTRHWCR
jgi:hypothetical protein